MSASRITKRKLDDAIEKLDSALAPPTSSSESPQPTKRPNTTRTSSIYTSLSKYKLFRSASSRESTTRTPNISQPYALSSRPPYRPDSTPDFLARLSTFKLTTYRDKPSEINAVAAAKAGWTNEGKERLVCGFCTSSWVLASTSGLSKDAARTLIEQQRIGLVANHKDFCPWKKAQCYDSVYRIPLKGPTALAKELKVRADALTHLVDGVEVQHPLTAKDITSLTETVKLVSQADAHATTRVDVDAVDDAVPEVDSAAVTLTEIPSSTALILALFGWDASPFIHPGASPHHSALTPLHSSLSRASTPSLQPPHVGTLSQRHSMSLSRASGQALSSAIRIQHRQSLPAGIRPNVLDPSATEFGTTSNPGRPASLRTSSGGSNSLADTQRSSTRRHPSDGSTSSSLLPVKEFPDANSVIHCQLCLRRVGLWSFRANESGPSETDTAQPAAEQPLSEKHDAEIRTLDVIMEHRVYCPYVTKSTVVPVPVFSDAAQTAKNASSGSISSLRRSLSLGSRSKSSEPINRPVEGWRAVFTVVQRSGLGLRFRKTGLSSQNPSTLKDTRKKASLGRAPSVSFAVPEEGATPTAGGSPLHHAMDVDAQSEAEMDLDEANMDAASGVEKIVENVKKSKEGSRELLRYVKDLLRRGDSSSAVPTSSTPPRTPSRTSGWLGLGQTSPSSRTPSPAIVG